MKRYSFIFFLASFLGVTSFTACEEEATLDGATEVYITIDPMDINLKLGDTVRISATVTNVSGKVIETPVSWSIEDQTVAALLGDTAVVALDGGQEKETRLKAMLENGKYALTTVTVSRNLPDGVMCIPNDSTFTEMTSKRSYNTAHDSVLFSCTSFGDTHFLVHFHFYCDMSRFCIVVIDISYCTYFVTIGKDGA